MDIRNLYQKIKDIREIYFPAVGIGCYEIAGKKLIIEGEDGKITIYRPRGIGGICLGEKTELPRDVDKNVFYKTIEDLIGGL